MTPRRSCLLKSRTHKVVSVCRKTQEKKEGQQRIYLFQGKVNFKLRPCVMLSGEQKKGWI
jgi:hypothetical protein